MLVSTRPLPGIGSGSTTSNALRRSVVTISMCAVVHRVDVAHLALVDALEALQVRFVHRGRGGAGCGHDAWDSGIRQGLAARAVRHARRRGRAVLQAYSPTVKETMGWYGKLIGAVLGAIIGRGLFGAIVGFVIGHQFDRKAGGTSRAARPGAGRRATCSRCSSAPRSR